MNKNQMENYKMLQCWKDRVTYLEGKFKGLHTLIGVISKDVDVVINKHKDIVKNDIDFAFDKIDQYEQQFLKDERQKG